MISSRVESDFNEGTSNKGSSFKENTHKAKEGESENEKEGESKYEHDLYTELITKAPYVRGDDSDYLRIEDIPWYDKSLIEDNKAFYRKHSTFLILSTTFALLYGFAVKPNSAVIIMTGKLFDPELSFRRYLSTIQRVAKFFIYPIDPERSHKALQTVRKMHILARKQTDKSHYSRRLKQTAGESEPWKAELCLAMKNDLRHIDTSSAPKHLLTWDPPVAISQFDMVTTQLGFIGAMWLFPKTFGIENREEEMKGYIHSWAVFGRVLGIKDEFNICIKPDHDLYQKLFTNIVVEGLKSMDETVVTIQMAFMEALSKRLPFMTYKAMFYTGLRQIDGYKGLHLWKLMTWTDKVSVFLIQSWVWGIRNSVVYRIIMNISTGLWLQFQFWMHLSTSLFD